MSPAAISEAISKYRDFIVSSSLDGKPYQTSCSAVCSDSVCWFSDCVDGVVVLTIQQHFNDKHRRLSGLQINTLSDAISGLHRYMTVWKKQELARRGAPVRNNGKRGTKPSRRRREDL